NIEIQYWPVPDPTVTRGPENDTHVTRDEKVKAHDGEMGEKEKQSGSCTVKNGGTGDGLEEKTNVGELALLVWVQVLGPYEYEHKHRSPGPAPHLGSMGEVVAKAWGQGSSSSFSLYCDYMNPERLKKRYMRKQLGHGRRMCDYDIYSNILLRLLMHI
ncbi:hypothetical protein STEG23_015724, partial [Scotinomys teguina]